MRRGRSLRSHERWSDKHLAPWAIISLVLTVVQYMFSLHLIGVGSTYRLWITWLPLVLGSLLLALFRWRYALLRIKDMETLPWKIIMCAFLGTQAVLFSYTSFGLVARTMADLLARTEMRTGSVHIEQYPIRSASMRRRDPKVYFIRNGEVEVLHAGYVPELAETRRIQDFGLVLRTTPGILGSTIVLDGTIVRN